MDIIAFYDNEETGERIFAENGNHRYALVVTNNGRIRSSTTNRDRAKLFHPGMIEVVKETYRRIYEQDQEIAECAASIAPKGFRGYGQE